jgi:hypothetical protein
MTAADVAKKLKELSADYLADNSWFRFYSGGDGFDPMNPDKYADAAGKAYVHVQKATTPLPLGDTKIRSDAELVSNFGVSDAEAPPPTTSTSTSTMTSTSGPTPIGTMARAGSSTSTSTSSSASPPGAILSNKKWSPMLNDAFIIGGVHMCEQFVFAPVGDDLSFIGSLAPGGAGGSPKQQQIDAAIPAWRAFFQTKSYLLWDRGYPRVFVRELLGLQKFGYTAAPSAVNLSFDCTDKGLAETATFKEYVQELKDTGFYANDQRKVLPIIAAFLFGKNNANALDSIIGR